MSVLLIEDEAKLAAYLAAGLSSEGWTTDIVSDGIVGLRVALEGRHDTIILDRSLPGLGGLALLKALRTRSLTPVVMLTARCSVEDRIEGLRAGADDYLAKPFSFSELVARLQAIDRRTHSTKCEAAPATLKLASLEMDLDAGRATRAGRRLDLTAKEYRMLELLLHRQGKVVSRSVLADLVWGLNFDCGTNIIDVAIGRLRLKLDVPFERKLLHTVRGMGYVLEDRGR